MNDAFLAAKATGTGFLVLSSLAVGAQLPWATDYQTQRLFAPTPRMLEEERAGRVFIYDALDTREVDAALDTQFERIENMMFIRIRRPTPADPAVVEVDDDC